MHSASVTCDLCGAPAPLEAFNGNSNFRMPEGWVTISPHVQVHGELRDKTEKKYEFKARLKDLIPKYHLCPDCTADKEKLAREKEAAEIEARKITQLTEPARRVFTLE